MSGGWEIGAIRLATVNGDREVAGWINGVFGIDHRAAIGEAEKGGCAQLWLLTHLATGYVVCAIDASLPAVQRFAEELALAGDWMFSDASEAKGLAGAYLKVKKKFGESRVYRGSAVTMPDLGSRLPTPATPA